MKFSIQTLGCKINQFDAGAFRDKLMQAGAVQAAPGEAADVRVVFTCTVTKKSDYQCRQAIRRAVKEKPEGGKVIVAGCYARTNPEEIRAIPGVDMVLGGEGGDVLVSALIPDAAREGGAFAAQAVGGRSRAFLKVQDGCNAFCSYCIVPYARGRSRSADAGEVLRQAERLVAEGYHEIVLTGVHLGAYGADIGGGTSLASLMKRLLDTPGLGRLRLSSIEPMEITDELIELFAHERVCRHFHIPLQSADDGVLDSMGRGYTWAEFSALLAKIDRKAPGACLGADVIVGYPAEDAEAFERTLARIGDSPLNWLHVFTYSPRPGTRAYELGDPVRGDEKRERSARLRALAAERYRAFREGFIGRELGVVVERCMGGVCEGLSDNYIRARFAGDGLRARSLARVRAGGIDGEFCKGELVKAFL